MRQANRKYIAFSHSFSSLCKHSPATLKDMATLALLALSTLALLHSTAAVSYYFSNVTIGASPIAVGCGLFTMSYQLWCGPLNITSYVALMDNCQLTSPTQALDGDPSQIANGTITTLASGVQVTSACPVASAYARNMVCGPRIVCNLDWPGPDSNTATLCLVLSASLSKRTITLNTTKCDISVEGASAPVSTSSPPSTDISNDITWWQILIIVVAGVVALPIAAGIVYCIWRCCRKASLGRKRKVSPQAGAAAGPRMVPASAFMTASSTAAVKAEAPAAGSVSSRVSDHGAKLPANKLDDANLYVPSDKPTTVRSEVTPPLPGAVSSSIPPTADPPAAETVARAAPPPPTQPPPTQPPPTQPPTTQPPPAAAVPPPPAPMAPPVVGTAAAAHPSGPAHAPQQPGAFPAALGTGGSFREAPVGATPPGMPPGAPPAQPAGQQAAPAAKPSFFSKFKTFGRKPQTTADATAAAAAASASSAPALGPMGAGFPGAPMGGSMTAVPDGMTRTAMSYNPGMMGPGAGGPPGGPQPWQHGSMQQPGPGAPGGPVMIQGPPGGMPPQYMPFGQPPQQHLQQQQQMFPMPPEQLQQQQQQMFGMAQQQQLQMQQQLQQQQQQQLGFQGQALSPTGLQDLRQPSGMWQGHAGGGPPPPGPGHDASPPPPPTAMPVTVLGGGPMAAGPADDDPAPLHSRPNPQGARLGDVDEDGDGDGGLMTRGSFRQPSLDKPPSLQHQPSLRQQPPQQQPQPPVQPFNTLDDDGVPPALPPARSLAPLKSLQPGTSPLGRQPLQPLSKPSPQFADPDLDPDLQGGLGGEPSRGGAGGFSLADDDDDGGHGGGASSRPPPAPLPPPAALPPPRFGSLAPLGGGGAAGVGETLPPPRPPGGLAPLAPLPGPRKLTPMSRKSNDFDIDDELAGRAGLGPETSFGVGMGTDAGLRGAPAGGKGPGGGQGGGLEDLDDEDFDREITRPPAPRQGFF